MCDGDNPKRDGISQHKGPIESNRLLPQSSPYSFDRELALKLENFFQLAQLLKFEIAKKGDMIEVTERVALDFWLGDYRFSDEFFVVPDLSEKLLIGTATTQKWRFKLDAEHQEVIIDPRVTKLRLTSILKRRYVKNGKQPAESHRVQGVLQVSSVLL